MTLVAADLLLPSGEIDGALFYPALSSGEVSTRIGAYITQGYALAVSVSDAAVRAFVYYRAWSDVVNMLTLTPASVSLAGEVSSSRLQSQINEWIAQRNAWRTLYISLLPVDPNAVKPIIPGTQAVPLRTTF